MTNILDFQYLFSMYMTILLCLGVKITLLLLFLLPLHFSCVPLPPCTFLPPPPPYTFLPRLHFSPPLHFCVFLYTFPALPYTFTPFTLFSPLTLLVSPLTHLVSPLAHFLTSLTLFLPPLHFSCPLTLFLPPLHPISPFAYQPFVS